MSMQPICNSLFFVHPLHEGAYQLEIQFLDERSDLVSRKNVFFTQQHPVETGETLDIYSQNGVHCDPIMDLFQSRQSGLFTKHDEKGIQKAAEKMEPLKLQGPTVIVLDMKDGGRSYLDKPSIKESEATFCEFLTQENPDPSFTPRAKKVHRLYQEALSCDFVICEGALKSDLLKQFSEAEAAWFLQQRQGAISFCQFAEFYMNGFKLGQTSNGIRAEDYFLPVSTQYHCFKPQAKSTVWYPSAYKKIYSLEGDFVKTMNSAFTISGSFDTSTEITSITMGLRV